MKPTEFLVEHRLPINEQKTYKLWENAGRKLVEAQLTADQINQIFQQAEQGATADGDNRTLLGKGKDVASAVNKAWEDLKTKVQDSGPIKNVDAMYDQAAEKLKQATGGDRGVMKYVQMYRDFAKKHPVAQGLIYSALIAAAGISGAGLGGAAALGLFKMVDKLLQGEKFSSAAYSGAKTGAMAYGASKLGDLVKDKTAPYGSRPGENELVGKDFQLDNPSGDAQKMFGGDADSSVTPWGTLSDKELMRQSYDAAVQEFIKKYAQDPNNPSAQVLKMARDAAKAKVYGKTMGESIELSEAVIKLVFAKTELEHQKMINEGIMDTLKGAAGKAAGWVATKGKNLTTKVTADKLQSAWEKAGKPTDSGRIATILVKNGVGHDMMYDIFTKMNIPVMPTDTAQPTTSAAPAAKPEAPPAKPAGAKPTTPTQQPAQAASAAPAAPAKPGVNPELQKRLAARKSGKPAYAGNLEEEQTDEGQIYSTGGGAGQSYRKFRPKSESSIMKGIQYEGK